MNNQEDTKRDADLLRKLITDTNSLIERLARRGCKVELDTKDERSMGADFPYPVVSVSVFQKVR